MGLIRKNTLLLKKWLADIVFCVDCTGSMKPVIDNIKAHADKFVEDLNANQRIKIDWRLRAMVASNSFIYKLSEIIGDNCRKIVACGI